MRLEKTKNSFQCSKNDNIEKERGKRFKRIVKCKTFWIVCVCVVLALAILMGVNINGRVITTAESALKSVVVTSEVSTIEYIYNSIISVSEKNTDKYHVAYCGTVKIGFDFNKIKITKDKKQKKIYVKLPDVKITSANVDEKSLEFIFEKGKYEKENIYQEAYRKCKVDLEKKAKDNKNGKRTRNFNY